MALLRTGARRKHSGSTVDGARCGLPDGSGADDGKVGKPDIRQARCGCVGVQDAGGRSFGVPGSCGLFRITGAGGENGGKGAGSVQGTVVCSWNVVEKKQEHIFSFCMLS